MVKPNPEYTGDVKHIRLVGYVHQAKPVILGTKECTSLDSVKFVLPNRGKQEYLGARIELTTDSTTTITMDWRAIYFPKGKALDYQGNPKTVQSKDFEAYWNKTRQILATIPMNEELIPVPEKDSATGKCYKVKLQSWNNIPIYGWYMVPKDVDPFPMSEPKTTKRYPAIQVMPGWGGEAGPYDRTADGYVSLGLNPRAHGPSKEFFVTEPTPHHLWNIENSETYYYRAAYMDCLRGIDFLCSRPEVDTTLIGAWGSSQGGAFTVAVCALDHRIKCGTAMVPYISNFNDFGQLATVGSGSQFYAMMTAKATATQVQKTLSYIDAANLAPWIQCPFQVCIAMEDRVCPPIGGIVIKNRIGKNIPTRLIRDPLADHEVTETFTKANIEWMDRYLKGPGLIPSH